MLDLDSKLWSSLSHAYGDASDIPALLRQLKDMPVADEGREPWFSLWSALAHQGDVYSASFAAVPHVVAALELSPSRASYTYFQFPAWVEICRHRSNIAVPDTLMPAYKEALDKLPKLVALVPSSEWSSDMLVCALAAIGVARGFYSVAEASMELRPEVAEEFLEWFREK